MTTWHPIRSGSARRVLKVCCCCGVVFEWRAAKFVGIQDDGVERIELRNHSCGSTNARVVAIAKEESAA